MEPALRQHLMDQARAEAELGWAEGGIPIGAVLATEAGEVVARAVQSFAPPLGRVHQHHGSGFADIPTSNMLDLQVGLPEALHGAFF